MSTKTFNKLKGPVLFTFCKGDLFEKKDGKRHCDTVQVHPFHKQLSHFVLASGKKRKHKRRTNIVTPIVSSSCYFSSRDFQHNPYNPIIPILNMVYSPFTMALLTKKKGIQLSFFKHPYLMPLVKPALIF